MDYILFLPCELIQTIAKRLDVRSFGRWMLTCTRMKEYLDDDIMWKLLYRRDIVAASHYPRHGTCSEHCWESIFLTKECKQYSYKKKIAHVLHPFTLGTTPCYPSHSRASLFYTLLRCVNWMTKAESLKLCVLTIAERKYVFLVQLRNWNYATSSSIRLDLILWNKSMLGIIVRGDWMFKWIPTYNAASTYVFSEEETLSLKPMPTKPLDPPLKMLHNPRNYARENPLNLCGNELINRGFLSMEMVEIPVVKLRTSVIRISQNYRFLTTADDYQDVVDYIHETSLIDNEKELV